MTAPHDVEPESPEAAPPAPPEPWNERIALGVFVAYLAIAAVIIVRSFSWMWFLGDDWGMVDGRDLLSLEGVWAPQNSHPSALPVVVFGVLYRLFGLDTYLPYLGATLALHLALAALLRVVMRRAGVGPWIATITAGTFVLFGTGWQNMVMGIQVSMVGSMVFGIAQLILADHDGPFRRRDALAIVAGLIALSASSVGIPMAFMVGLAVLIRRGPKMATIQTLPLAAAYVIWTLWAATLNTFTNTGLPRDLGQVARWVRDAGTGIFLSFAQYPVAAVAVAVLLVAGLVLAWSPLSISEARKQASAPFALLVGCVVLIAIIGSQRAAFAEGLGAELARSSRYMAMGVALVLPALAVAANVFVRRWPISTPVVVILLLIGVPGNIAALDPGDPLYNELVMNSQRQFVAQAAASPLIDDVPGETMLDPNEFFTSNLTAGFLAYAKRIGRVPEPDGTSPVLTEVAETRLSLAQGAFNAVEPPHTCKVHDEPITITPEAGDQFIFQGSILVRLQDADGEMLWPTGYNRQFSGGILTANVADQTYQIGPAPSMSIFTWCTVP